MAAVAEEAVEVLAVALELKAAAAVLVGVSVLQAAVEASEALELDQMAAAAVNLIMVVPVGFVPVLHFYPATVMNDLFFNFFNVQVMSFFVFIIC